MYDIFSGTAALFRFDLGSVHLEKCSFTWTQNENQKLSSGLKIASLDIEPGTLVGVVGFVGSGKSSLLAAIMGDMHRIEGSIQVTVN